MRGDRAHGPDATEGERQGRRDRAAPLVAVALGALLAVPASNVMAFSGVPLGGTVEFLGVLGAAPLLFSRTLREAYARVWRARAVLAPAVLALAVAGLVVKGALFATAADEGFRACYRPLDVEPAGSCEPSYENPLGRHGATRVERVVDFAPHPPDRQFPSFGLTRLALEARMPLPMVAYSSIQHSNWNLSFLNSSRFNFYAGGNPDIVRRPWLRFTATWTGAVRAGEGERLRVAWLGEGRVLVGDRAVGLSPRYDRVDSVSFDLPPGAHRLTVEYRFAGPPPGDVRKALTAPYATFRLLDGSGEPLRTVGPSTAAKAAGRAADAVVLVLLAGVAVAYARVLRPLWWLAPAVAAPLVVVSRLGEEAYVHQVSALLVVGLFALLLVRHADGDPATVGLAAYGAVAAVEVTRALTLFGSLPSVLYRGGGHDFLTYENHARAILESGSLQAGEDVFTFSSGFRYLVFAAHVLFGDHDVVLGVAVAVALTVLVFAVSRRVLALVPAPGPAPRRGRGRTAAPAGAAGARRWAALAACLAVVVAVEGAGVEMVQVLLSEPATWVLVLSALYLLLGPPTAGRLVAASALAAVTFVVRANQGVATLALLAVAVLALAGGRRVMVAGAAVGVFVAIALLPAAHNVRYGGELAFVARTPDLPVNFPLPPGRLLHLGDAEVRSTLADQLRGVSMTARLVPQDIIGLQQPFVVAIRVVQGLWLVAVARLVAHRRRVTARGWLLALLPVAFLLPHVFVQVYVYYPRHVMAGYLVAGVAAAYAFGEGPLRPAPVRRGRA